MLRLQTPLSQLIGELKHKLLVNLICLAVVIGIPVTSSAGSDQAENAGRALAPLLIPASDYIFICDYINYAWGFIYRGFYINAKGEIHKFESHEMSRDPRKDAKLIGQIELDELKEKIMLITPASKGKIIREHAAYDAGGKGCTASLSDISSDKYSTVQLGSIGIVDFEVKNTSKEAQHLLRWLQGVEKKYVQPHNKRSEQTP